LRGTNVHLRGTNRAAMPVQLRRGADEGDSK
jgi:hypothetical protein